LRRDAMQVAGDMVKVSSVAIVEASAGPARSGRADERTSAAHTAAGVAKASYDSLLRLQALAVSAWSVTRGKRIGESTEDRHYRSR
jgi:hypothetical protein